MRMTQKYKRTTNCGSLRGRLNEAVQLQTSDEDPRGESPEQPSINLQLDDPLFSVVDQRLPDWRLKNPSKVQTPPTPESHSSKQHAYETTYLPDQIP